MKKYFNKLMIILLFAIACIFFANSNVHASFDFTYDGTKHSLPDLPFDTSVYPYYRITTNSNDDGIYYILNYTSEAFYLCVVNDGDTVITNPAESFIYFYRPSSSFSWVASSSNPQSSGSNFIFSLASLVYSSIDVCDTDGNVVFLKASPLEEVGELAKVVTQETLQSPLEEIVGILPIVMIIVVSLLALRKALAFLQTFLRRS